MSDTRNEALAWLEARQAGVPGVLRGRVREAVERVGPSAATPEAILRKAADRLFAETVEGGAMTDPITLLAADALITYVCEYRSAHAPETLHSLQ